MVAGVPIHCQDDSVIDACESGNLLRKNLASLNVQSSFRIEKIPLQVNDNKYPRFFFELLFLAAGCKCQNSGQCRKESFKTHNATNLVDGLQR